MKYTHVIFQYVNGTAFWNKLTALGVVERKDEEGDVVKVENRAFAIMTPPMKLSGTGYAQAARCLAEDISRIQGDQNPAFQVVWNEQETTEENANPRPTFEVDSEDADNNPIVIDQLCGSF